MKLSFSSKELAIVIGLIAVFTFISAPYLDDYPVFRGRNAVCRSNLREIGKLIAEYKGHHQGKMPADLAAFVVKKNKTSLTCPWNGKAGYTYRAANNPTYIIFWDSETNYLPGLFWRRTIKNRNVLYGNGKVEAMEESEFQKLGLTGMRIVSPK